MGRGAASPTPKKLYELALLSVEFEAYSMQAIFQGIYRGWLDTRGRAARDVDRS